MVRIGIRGAYHNAFRSEADERNWLLSASGDHLNEDALVHILCRQRPVPVLVNLARPQQNRLGAYGYAESR